MYELIIEKLEEKIAPSGLSQGGQFGKWPG